MEMSSGTFTTDATAGLGTDASAIQRVVSGENITSHNDNNNKNNVDTIETVPIGTIPITANNIGTPEGLQRQERTGEGTIGELGESELFSNDRPNLVEDTILMDVEADVVEDEDEDEEMDDVDDDDDDAIVVVNNDPQPMEVTHVTHVMEGTDNSTTGSSISDVSGHPTEIDNIHMTPPLNVSPSELHHENSQDHPHHNYYQQQEQQNSQPQQLVSPIVMTTTATGTGAATATTTTTTTGTTNMALPPRPSNGTGTSATSSASSFSSSSGSSKRPGGMNQQQQQQPQQQQQQQQLQTPSPAPPSFRDGDSFSSAGRASSQNSSRDWGWFEDVHTTGSLTGGTSTGGAGAGGNSNAANNPVARQRQTNKSSQQQPQQNQQQQTSSSSSTDRVDRDTRPGVHQPQPQLHGHEREHPNASSQNPSASGSTSGRQVTAIPTRSSAGGNGGISTPRKATTSRSSGGSGGASSRRGSGGLLPNIGLMMESPNHSSTGGDDDYYFNPSLSQELLEPIIMPGISPRDVDEAAVQAVTAPNYVLEESLSSQKLWKDTAGNRPPQPLEERAFFEKMWAQNFARSQVEYKMPVEVLTATTPISLSPFADGNFASADHPHGQTEVMSNYNLGVPTTAGDGHSTIGAHGGSTTGGGTDVAEATLVSRLNDPRGPSHVHSPLFTNGIMTAGEPYEIVNRKVKGSGSDGDLTILLKGENCFGTTVSKSFARPGVSNGLIAGVDTVNISIASYRVVESKKHGKFAQFLVIYREGSIRDTIGVWKRYSDFQDLAKKVTKAHEGCAAVIANISPLAITEEHDVEHLPNAITSWRLLKKRQRWYRCLDAGYLSLKIFLLERFLHDILFESSTPTLLRDFVGVPPPRN